MSIFSHPRHRTAPARVLSGTMHVAGVGRAFPAHRYDQEALLGALRALWTAHGRSPSRLEEFHRSVQVGARHLALPLEEYGRLRGFSDSNDAFVRVATDIGAEAIEAALAAAGLEAADVDALFFVTVTGVAVPTVDARLMNRLGFRSDVKRIPIFGLGCVAGAAGIARMADYLRAYPADVAVLLSVELCSLTLQREDFSIPNLIASGLFGDGAAAVVGLGAARASGRRFAGPRVIASRSRFYRDTERVMGWDVGEKGFKIVLSAGVPEVVRTHIGADVDGFLAERGLARGDIATWICHPGGPKVLEAMQEALGVGPDALALTWRSLREVGNLSSASVLLVLADTIAERRPADGSYGMILAMGPGFCSEMVLVQW